MEEVAIFVFGMICGFIVGYVLGSNDHMRRKE